MESVVDLPIPSTARTQAAGLASGVLRSRIKPPTSAFALVANEMAAAEGQLRVLLGSRVEEVPAVSGYLADAGGKRLRPLLTALGARAVGVGGDLSRLMCVGEIVHLGSLLHDDVIDAAETRRGRPAAHHVFGNPAVILTGDFCLARAVLLAAEEGGHGCAIGLSEAMTRMVEGELLQLRHAGGLTTRREDYVEVIDGKSAALIAWCASAGAWILEDPSLAARMSAFGRGVGIAFQITDDVLDYGGELAATGKLPGADLRERKLTLPLLFALERVDGLRERLEAGPPGADELPILLRQVRECGALEDSLDAARGQVAEAVAALDSLDDTPYRAALVELADFLVERVA